MLKLMLPSQTGDQRSHCGSRRQNPNLTTPAHSPWTIRRYRIHLSFKSCSHSRPISVEIVGFSVQASFLLGFVANADVGDGESKCSHAICVGAPLGGLLFLGLCNRKGRYPWGRGSGSMMALLLPQWAPPESLHRLANARRQRSRKSARATHGTTQNSTSTKASTDHFKIPSTEPCCNLISPLVMRPRKPVRRSSRLRVRRGNREDVNTDTQTDMDAAEWYSRVLANNGVVEVDPVTLAEQMQHAKYYQADSNDNNNTYYHYGSSSDAQDVYPSRSAGFPSRVPLGVALAAGSAVALAIIALLIQALHKESDGTDSKSSDSEDRKLTNSFKGKPVAQDLASKVSQQASNSKEVLATSAATGSPFFNFSGRNKTPSPPSLSKGEKSWSESKYASVAPFFPSDTSTTSYSRPAPPPVSRWEGDKYKSVRPFFPDEAAASTETVGPSFSDEQGSQGKNENGSSANKTVTPFFADDQQGNKNAKRSASLQNIPPFFPDDQQGSKNSKGSASLQNIPPFFPDEQQGSKNSKGSASLQNIPPFFPDDQQGSKNAKGSASLQNIPPFFPDDQQGSKNAKGSASLQNIPPFFPDEQQSKNGPSLESVAPFFADEQQGRNSTGVSQSKGAVKVENVKPFFPDEQVGTASGSGSSRQSSGSMWSQFWDARNKKRDSPAASPIPENLPSGTVQSDGKQMLKEIAGKPPGQHKEFVKGTTEERLAPNTSGALSFQSDREAPEVARALSSDERALLEAIKAEEERRFAKMQALQAAFPALAIGAGAVGALVGVDGAFEMVGITATASFISYELLWANKRQELVDEITSITDHHKLFSFLQKRKIVKDDC